MSSPPPQTGSESETPHNVPGATSPPIRAYTGPLFEQEWNSATRGITLIREHHPQDTTAATDDATRAEQSIESDTDILSAWHFRAIAEGHSAARSIYGQSTFTLSCDHNQTRYAYNDRLDGNILVVLVTVNTISTWSISEANALSLHRHNFTIPSGSENTDENPHAENLRASHISEQVDSVVREITAIGRSLHEPWCIVTLTGDYRGPRDPPTGVRMELSWRLVRALDLYERLARTGASLLTHARYGIGPYADNANHELSGTVLFKAKRHNFPTIYVESRRLRYPELNRGARTLGGANGPDGGNRSNGVNGTNGLNGIHR